MKAQSIEAGRTTALRPGKRRRANDLGIFTWNVLSLYRSGALPMLTEKDLHNISIRNWKNIALDRSR
jgi:hypothetical protein